MPYVYSTATASNVYRFYKKGGGDLPVADGEVTIKGGANVANKHLMTPLGIVTRVTDDEAEKLKHHPTFKKHMERGFMTIRNDHVDGEVAAADMQGRDGSAPLTDNDFAEGKEPVVGSATDDDDEPVARKRGGGRKKNKETEGDQLPPLPPKAG